MSGEIKRYIPEFYERDFGKTNTVSHTVELFQQILDDIKNDKFNNYTDDAVVKKEFKVDDVIMSGFKIRDISFLKAYFAFKGTNLDLQYILNNIGYESVIYNDGGYVHRNKDGTERVIPVSPFYKDKISEPRCQIEIKVIIDLNTDIVEGFTGYNGLDLARIRAVCQERLNSCSYLSEVFVEMSVREYYETMAWTEDFFTVKRSLGLMADNYFTDYKLPDVIYGEEFNDALKYGKEYNDGLAYGRHNQILFKPLDDTLFMQYKQGLNENAMGINDGAGTIQLGDILQIISVKPLYEYYNFGIADYLQLGSNRTMWFADDEGYPTLEAQDNMTLFKGRIHRFIEHPDAYYYGKESNDYLRYGVAKGADEYGDKSGEVVAYGQKPKNQGTESPALSINGDNPDAIINMQDNVEIKVRRTKE